MAILTDYEDYDGIALARLIRTGELSAQDALDSALDRIERYDPALNAVVYIAADAPAERPLPASPLAGVPLLLKDLGTAVAGQPLSNGSQLFRGVVPDSDSTLAERYRAAGLLFIGKTNTPEFGISMTTEPAAFGPTRNPWDLTRSPGGSSGGAAAAVAAGMVPLAHASDGGGSIRMPAANCGLFGLKPTRARTPLGPAVGEGWGGLAVAHCVSRSVRDSAALLDLSHGPAAGDPYAVPAPPLARPFGAELGLAPGPLRIALMTAAPESTPTIAVHPDCSAAAVDAARLCESLGHRIEEAVFEYDYGGLNQALRVVIGANLRFALEQRWAQLGRQPGPDDIETITWLWCQEGRRRTTAEYAAAINFIHAFGRRMAGWFQHYDCLLTPTLAQPPLPLGLAAADMQNGDLNAYLKTVDFMPFTQIYNVSGCPAMSVPLYWNRQGLPIGVQFGAAAGRESLLLRLAAQLERARPWFKRRPVID